MLHIWDAKYPSQTPDVKRLKSLELVRSEFPNFGAVQQATDNKTIVYAKFGFDADFFPAPFFRNDSNVARHWPMRA